MFIHLIHSTVTQMYHQNAKGQHTAENARKQTADWGNVAFPSTTTKAFLLWHHSQRCKAVTMPACRSWERCYNYF